MKKRFFLLCCSLAFYGAFLRGQSLLADSLPASVREVLKDYAWIGGGAFTQGHFTGRDSFQYTLQRRTVIESHFFLQRHEVSVGQYRRFMEGTGKQVCDTLVWTREFPFTYNDTFIQNYFQRTEYPMVGIRWDQAVAYCTWETARLNRLLDHTPYRVVVRLPTSEEWEFAAIISPYEPNADPHKPIHTVLDHFPWIGPYLYDNRFHANGGALLSPLGQEVYNSAADGFRYTAPVHHFEPNAMGLYQMAGNVSEWVAESYARYAESVETTLREAEKLAPYYYRDSYRQCRPRVDTRAFGEHKIVKGGSWHDEPFYLQSGVIQAVSPTEASSLIGFRTALEVWKKP